MLAGLLDVSFTRLVTPRLVGGLYVCAFSAVATVALVGFLCVWSLAGWLGPGMWWFLLPLVCAALAALLAVRVVLEVAMVYMRGHLPEPSAPAPAPVATPVRAGVPYGVPLPGADFDPASSTRYNTQRWHR